MFGSLGIPELVLIFVVVLLVFGPRKLPEVGRTLGKALGEFRKATDDFKNSIEREVRLEELKKISPATLIPFEPVSNSEPFANGIEAANAAAAAAAQQQSGSAEGEPVARTAAVDAPADPQPPAEPSDPAKA